jgi:hypothetical protein
MQTALDLLEDGIEVHLVCDALSSQRPHDRSVGIARMVSAGAQQGSCESVVFDLLRTADHPNFREVSNLLKEHNMEENEFRHDVLI